MDLLFLYYKIGEGETVEIPDLPGIKHLQEERIVSIPVKAHFSFAKFADNSWATTDPQAMVLFRDFNKLNKDKKEFFIWKHEVKTNIPVDGFLDFIEERGKTIVNVGMALLGIYAVNKLFFSKK